LAELPHINKAILFIVLSFSDEGGEGVSPAWQAPIVRLVLNYPTLIFALVLLAVSHGRAATRIAFLPSFSDFEKQSPMRAALPAFDARLQAELLTGWDSEVLSRAGLSAVVFEQKLRAAKSASASALRVLPAGFLVISVLDQPKS